ncbi:pyridoxal phosphate-dependent aminotransferase [Ruminococcaceae bacterium OttesenSCG-928-A11]|nr:pyridoxal phosphate-dependent aminotransferase [Ruminococcaceae bacterium OttesenSCG-928-A11]
MKHKFVAKRYWKDQSTAMGASDVAAKSYTDVINLSLGDPDLVTDEIIIDGAFADAKAGHTKYTDFRGDPELRAEIVKFYDEKYGMAIKDENVMVTTSGCIAMYLALEAILDDGDEVIIHTPCFTPYPQQVELARGIPVPLETYEEEDFQINIERLKSRISERTKAIVINTPANPTGAAFSIETLQNVAAIAKEYDLVVIADDIYTLFTFDADFVPIASLPGMAERTITINSFSKDYLMTGWRIGYIIAPEPIVQTIQQINENVAFTSPSVSQRAALHALRNRAAIQSKILEEYKGRVLAATERINAIPNMSVRKPQGTFYLFINIKATGKTSAQVADAILHQAHVLVLPGNTFGACGEGYVRIACTCSVDKLDEAFDRIAKMPMFHQ